MYILKFNDQTRLVEVYDRMGNYVGTARCSWTEIERDQVEEIANALGLYSEEDISKLEDAISEMYDMEGDGGFETKNFDSCNDFFSDDEEMSQVTGYQDDLIRMLTARTRSKEFMDSVW